LVRFCQPRQHIVAAIEVILFALGASATLLGGSSSLSEQIFRARDNG
jgi:hypothetical protein